ncbi:CDP-alcohol phosphatidyltransferase family protein [Candidatus Micrarchaeota archaeon]|nr:CDP-alcohol phosphatidyltransferase family protein [Candidatus Micrarchaeota archaeon]
MFDMLKQSGSLKKFQETMGGLLAAIPLSPNHWTLISLLVAVLAAYTIATTGLVAGLILFAVAALLDFVDGAVARARNEVTKLGGFLDGVTDRFVEALLLFSLMFYPLPEIFIDAKIWLAGVLFFGTSMVSFVRAYADHKEVVSRENALKMGGLCERPERLIILITGMIAGIAVSMDYFVYSMILVIALSIITIMQRLSKAF